MGSGRGGTCNDGSKDPREAGGILGTSEARLLSGPSAGRRLDGSIIGSSDRRFSGSSASSSFWSSCHSFQDTAKKAAYQTTNDDDSH